MKVLVAYSSAYGSTAEIADRLAARLRARGAEARAEPVTSACAVRDYDAIVVGSAIHDGAWLPPAVEFMRDNARVLATKPVWLFSVGMVAALPRFLRARAEAAESTQVIARFRDRVQIRGAKLFSGVVRPEHLPPFGRVLFRCVGGRYGDFRDWNDIDGWADAVFTALTPRRAA